MVILLTCECREKCKHEYEHPESYHIAEETLFYLSLTILLFFAIETIALLFAFGLKFFKHPLYVSDLVIIVAALILEIVLKEELSSLLIITRIWRLIRIGKTSYYYSNFEGHAIVLVEEETHHRRRKRLKKKISALEETLRERDKSIARLQASLGLQEENTIDIDE